MSSLLPPVGGGGGSDGSGNKKGRSPSPFNHLPDSLALTLKVLKRYKREGRELSAEEAEILSGIAEVVKGFDIEEGGDSTANKTSKDTVDVPSLTVAAPAASSSSATTASAATNAVVSGGGHTVGSRLNAALSHAHKHQQQRGGGSSSSPNSGMTTPATAPLGIAATVGSPTNASSPATGGGEPLRVRDLINKLRRAADSGEVFKELMVKSATVDSLVEFAVACNKASNSRTSLATIIVKGMKDLASKNNGGLSRPVSASLNGSPAAMGLASGAATPRSVAATAQQQQLYGKNNMRLFLLNKNNEVLEDPLTGEMIGGIFSGDPRSANLSRVTSARGGGGNGTTPPSSSAAAGAHHPPHSSAVVPITAAVNSANSHAAVNASSDQHCVATTHSITTLGGLGTAGDLSPKRIASDAGDESMASVAPSANHLADVNLSTTAEDQQAHAAQVSMIVAAITECFLSGASGEDNIERGGHLFLPMTVDGECLGVLAIFEYKNTIDAQNKMHIVAASQSIAALSVRNVGLLEDVGWQMNKANAMLQMANQLAFDNLDERTLSQSIIVTAKQLIDADRCSIFVVKDNTLQAYFEDGKTVIISNQSGIAGHVARTGETVNIVEAYEDSRFNPSVDKATGYRTKTILCMPIRFGDQIVGVAQLINKNPLVVNSEMKDGATDKPTIARFEVERPFSARDEELFSTFSTFVGVSLRNCRINQGLQDETEKSRAILDVVAMLSQTDIRDVNNIASHVMAGAKKLLHADRSTLFLVDKESHELYAETLADNNNTGGEIRIPVGTGIAGKVASTQVAENIVDAYNNPDFDPSIDKALGYSTYSMLCEPIVYHNEVLAVAQLMNKVDQNASTTNPSSGEALTPFTGFTEKDQETFRTFAMFAGISISNAHMLRFAVDAGNELIALNTRIDANGGALSLESSMGGMPMSDHSVNIANNPSMRRRYSEVGKRKVSSSERQGILDALAILNSSPEIDVTSPSFDLFLVRSKAENPSDMGCAVVLKVFQQTGFLDLFQVDTEVFLNFICQCRRQYRKVPYHNFFHVVDACQTIYTFLFRGGIRELLSDWECFTLLVTAIVHDLDHMGVNNSFHLKTDSPLGILSSATGNTSVLEVHHCNLAIDILLDPTSNVFSGMDDATRAASVKSMIECVLATDMARHGEFLAKFESIIAGGHAGEDGGLNLNDAGHRKLVMDLVMKAADISNVTKPFELSRLWAVAVTEEFYRQGDQERARGVEVLPQFDRSKKTELAKGQIGFINFVCEKFFTVISSENAFPGMKWTLDNLLKNKQEWTEILNGTTRRPSLIDLTNSQEASPRTKGSFSVSKDGSLTVPSK